jgi:hypothetical protein
MVSDCSVRVVAGQVGDQVDAAGAVVEVDLPVGADGYDYQVGDGLPGGEVEVGGDGAGLAVGVDGDEAAGCGPGGGHVQHDCGHPG